MDIDYLVKTYLDNYNLLIEQISSLFTEESHRETLLILSSESRDKKWLRGVNFSKLLNDNLFEQFSESKVKLFTNNDEISKELFGDIITLKNIFTNRDDNIKFVLWSYLHLIVLMVELAQKKKNKDKIRRLTKVIETYAPELEKCKKKLESSNKGFGKDPKFMIKEMLGVDVNEQTNDMIADIVNSFESTLNGSSNGNPLSGIMDISKKISEKYQDKINKGDIQLDKLMEGIQKTIPGMDQILKGAGGAGGVGGMENMMSGLFGGKTEPKKETVIINENFSTSSIEVGKIKESSNLNIGKLLNVADSLGVIPGKQGSDSSQPNIMELFGMMNGLGNIKTKEEADALKSKVDNFMEKNLGLDINKITKDMEKMFNKKEDAEQTQKTEDLNKEIDELMKKED